MTVKEQIEQLRSLLHQHNYNYYVLNTPSISDQEFDSLMRQLQELEELHPEYQDENSPSVRVGSDINKIKKNFYKEIKDENINLFSNPFGNGDSAIKILDIIENEN